MTIYRSKCINQMIAYSFNHMIPGYIGLTDNQYQITNKFKMQN